MGGAGGGVCEALLDGGKMRCDGEKDEEEEGEEDGEEEMNGNFCLIKIEINLAEIFCLCASDIVNYVVSVFVLLN